jgi:ACR3 family arsenite efflux pump ArsB
VSSARQLVLLGGALLAGVLVGLIATDADETFHALTWAPLGAVLYLTFAQVDIGAIPGALGDRRFLGAALVGNFVLIPMLVALLVAPPCSWARRWSCWRRVRTGSRRSRASAVGMCGERWR